MEQWITIESATLESVEKDLERILEDYGWEIVQKIKNEGKETLYYGKRGNERVKIIAVENYDGVQIFAVRT